MEKFMSISEYALKAEAELQAKEETLKASVEEVASVKAELSALKKELDAKKKELAKQEKEISVEKRDVELKLSNVRRNDEINQALLDIETNRTFVKKTLKEANEKNADADQKLAEVAKRELALVKREAEYRDTIKKEIVEGFLKGLSK